MNAEPRIVRTLCAACSGRVYRAAKSHRHYSHWGRSDCLIRKVEAITMQTVVYREGVPA